MLHERQKTASYPNVGTKFLYGICFSVTANIINIILTLLLTEQIHIILIYFLYLIRVCAPLHLLCRRHCNKRDELETSYTFLSNEQS